MDEIDGNAKEALPEILKDEVEIEKTQEAVDSVEIEEPVEPKEEETALPENTKHREQGETLFIRHILDTFLNYRSLVIPNSSFLFCNVKKS